MSDTPPPAIPFVDLKAQYRRLKPAIDARIAAVLEHGRFILGPEVEELEERLAQYVGVRHCIGVSDGTTALQIALMALGVGPGDEVVTPSFTFIATAETIAIVGARPVFVDIDPRTYNLDPDRLEAAITTRTRAIMPVSLYGQCADMAAIAAIAARHGVAVIEDAAQSFGATLAGRRSCGLSAIGSTSFFPSKPLGAYGDGGALFTDDETLATRMRRIRVHGQDRRYHHVALGLNGRLDTLQAAVLLAKLDGFEHELGQRRAAARAYDEAIGRRLGERVRIPWTAPGCESVYAQYTIALAQRDRVAQALAERGVPTAVHYPIPLHRQPVFASLGLAERDFPASERAAAEVLSLPMHADLDPGTIDRIVEALEQSIAHVDRQSTS